MDLDLLAKEYRKAIRRHKLATQLSSEEISERILTAESDAIDMHGAVFRSLFHSQLRYEYPFLYYSKSHGLPVPDGASRRAFLPKTLAAAGIQTATLLEAIHRTLHSPSIGVRVPTSPYNDPISGLHRIQSTSPIDYKQQRGLAKLINKFSAE